MLARKKLLSLLRKLEAFIKVPSGGKVIPRRCFYSRKKMTAQDALVVRCAGGDNCANGQRG
jgi:hypothetical protein